MFDFDREGRMQGAAPESRSSTRSTISTVLGLSWVLLGVAAGVGLEGIDPPVLFGYILATAVLMLAVAIPTRRR